MAASEPEKAQHQRSDRPKTMEHVRKLQEEMAARERQEAKQLRQTAGAFVVAVFAVIVVFVVIRHRAPSTIDDGSVFNADAVSCMRVCVCGIMLLHVLRVDWFIHGRVVSRPHAHAPRVSLLTSALVIVGGRQM